MDTGLVAAGVGWLGRLVAERALVALMALAAVGEGIKGQAQPVHTPVGTHCCQDLLAWHQHADPISTERGRALHQRCTATGTGQPSRHSTGVALAWHQHRTVWHNSVLVARQGRVTTRDWRHSTRKQPQGRVGSQWGKGTHLCPWQGPPRGWSQWGPSQPGSQWHTGPWAPEGWQMPCRQ